MEAVLAEDVGDRLSIRDFSRLAKYIQSYAGIKMPQTKMAMVEGRLRRRVRAHGLRTVGEYCRYLFDNGGIESEGVYLIDAVTTNKTEFFREPEHFRALATKILPDIAANRTVNSKAPLKIWSVAASTGAEPYTLAMVASEFARERSGFRTTIFGTDICTEVLETAILGIYPEFMVQPVPEDYLKRYFMRARHEGASNMRVVPELRAMVRYGRLNLMDHAYPLDQDMDIIFCRNILIYFDKETQEAVLDRLCAHLRPGGYLFLGHSESAAGLQLPLTSLGNTIFRRA
jgi:chemotaxis protein methyltransferase CheR